jgi:hypothetical protein
MVSFGLTGIHHSCGAIELTAQDRQYKVQLRKMVKQRNHLKRVDR